jgi:hypothetical protein
MSSRTRVNLATALVLVAIGAVGGLMATSHATALSPTLAPVFTPATVCTLDPQFRVRPVGLLNEP